MTRHIVRPVVLLGAALCLTMASPAAEAADDPKPERFTLAEATIIEEVPCASGYAWRFPDGRLHRCTLEHDHVVRGAVLPKGSAVAFHADGSHAYVFLPKTTPIEGLECRGHGHDFMTTFHPDGSLKLCWMPENREVRGVPCAGFSFWADLFGNPSGVYLHPSGAVANCRLSRDYTVDGRVFQKGSRIHLDSQGRAARD